MDVFEGDETKYRKTHLKPVALILMGDDVDFQVGNWLSRGGADSGCV